MKLAFGHPITFRVQVYHLLKEVHRFCKIIFTEVSLSDKKSRHDFHWVVPFAVPDLLKEAAGLRKFILLEELIPFVVNSLGGGPAVIIPNTRCDGDGNH